MLRNWPRLAYTVTPNAISRTLCRNNTSRFAGQVLDSRATRRQHANATPPTTEEPPTVNVISITPRASDRFKYLLQRRNMDKGAIQLSVKEKGCAGLSYSMDFHNSANVTMDNGQSAILITQNDGYSIIVDRKSLGYLLGCEIDWLEGDVSSQFVFKNPNATHSCPCGRSFAT